MLKTAQKVNDWKGGRQRKHRVLEGQPDAGILWAAFDGGASTDNIPAITLSFLSAAIQAYHQQLWLQISEAKGIHIQKVN